MLHALVLLAADEAEPSKTAFYIAGGVLVAWAAILAAVGLTRSDFPGTATIARGLMALTAVLVAATMATAVITG